MNATRAPEAREEMTMGDEGYPQGYDMMSEAQSRELLDPQFPDKFFY